MEMNKLQSSVFKKNKQKKYITSRIILSLLIFIGILGFFSARWYGKLYGDIGVESVLYTMFAGMGGVQIGLVYSWLFNGLLPAVLITAVLIFLLLFLPHILYRNKDSEGFNRKRKISAVLAFVCFFVPFADAFCTIGLDDWVINCFSKTQIYQQEYVNPENTSITFPNQKRNLIYIYMESMETTFFSQDKGGALKENAIPELYSLAEKNINFSQNSSVGGGRCAYGTTWTIGAMLGQTAGIPLRAPVSMEANFTRKYYNNTYSINDILHENGYRQALMVGSLAQYGGREQYFLQHGVDTVYDLETAYKDGIVPEGYFEWWGMEDKYLFSYAKQKLTELSKGEGPFAFTMLTVDTHHVDGYACTECGNTFDQQYSNVLHCSSRQVSQFVEWISQQDFYANTTIVLTGDHCTMDYQFIKKNDADGDYTRRLYNCFINAAVSPENSKNREFLSLDMFPTTLAALGCSIEGERLGLGTNLFSSKQTLTEKYGYDYMQEELSKSSDYYNTEFD